MILTIDDGMDTVKGAIRALGRADEDCVVAYSNQGHTWVLAFDPRSNRLCRVSQVLPTVAGWGNPGRPWRSGSATLVSDRFRPYAGQSPVAIGRVGSAIHSLQDPT